VSLSRRLLPLVLLIALPCAPASAATLPAGAPAAGPLAVRPGGSAARVLRAPVATALVLGTRRAGRGATPRIVVELDGRRVAVVRVRHAGWTARTLGAVAAGRHRVALRAARGRRASVRAGVWLAPTTTARLRAPAAKPVPAPAPSTVWASPAGVDTAPGTSARPVRTLSRALAALPAGGTVVLAPGAYPAALDATRHAATVTVQAAGATVAGLHLYGATNVSVLGGSFTDTVKIDSRGLGAPSSAVMIDGADLTGGCFDIRDRASAIAIRNSHMHDCWTGVSGPGRVSAAYQSTGITIEGNLIERMRSDGIQFGDWNDVTIANNVIRDIRDPAGVIHNDGIQFTGGTQGARLIGNRISDASAAVLIQPAIRPIDDVLLQGNVLGPNAAVTVQSQGATHARFIANTMCGGKLGGLWLRAAPSGAAVTDTIVRDNRLSSFQKLEGARAGVDAGNVIGCG
jgi:Right handed beta helix region